MNRHRLLIRSCQACGCAFQARAADVRRGFGRACSPRCGGKLRGTAHPPGSHPVAFESRPDSDGLADAKNRIFRSESGLDFPGAGAFPGRRDKNL